MLFEVVVTCVLALQGIFAADWSYSGRHGPSHWKDIVQTCGQSQQSPINIFEGDVKEHSVAEPLVFHNYNTSNGISMTLRNNGHSAVVALGGDTEITVSGGGLPGVFRALQFHFHWGSDSNTGSEHLISSKAYPMEVHFVHYNTKYRDLSQAVSQKDGLAVLGFMYEVSTADNRNYDDIVNNLSEIEDSEHTENDAEISAVALNSLLPETFTNFYRYSGSLTTPSCQESVTWTVFKEPIKISERQLQKFRSLRDSHGHPLVNNYRPVQDLNSRTVVASFNTHIHWGYSEGHPDATHWGHYYSNCNGQSQSPIDISTANSQFDARIVNFNFKNYGSSATGAMRLKNNGHTAQLDFTSGDISISGGGLSGTYQAAQLHFHWGSSDKKGSEHTLDHHAYPVEIHIVHFKKSLGKLQEAATVPHGLAVLGIFCQISADDNPALKDIIDNLRAIQVPGSNVTIPAVNLNSLLPHNRDNFFRYNGSLTTPGCFQTVIWTVFKDTIKISSSQLAALRRLMSSEKDASGNKVALVDNFRPIQKLNNRIVLRTFPDVTTGSVVWSYQDQQHWYEEYPMCDDAPPNRRQSPINIPLDALQYQKYDPLKLSDYSLTVGVNMQIQNNGHTALIDVIGGTIKISGGGLEGMYKVASLHFHWGADSERGSEHAIDYQKYPMELHIVHYNMKYKNLMSALTKEDGLAVLGFLFEVSSADNMAYNVITDKLSEIQMPNTKVSMDTFALASILPKDMNKFYRYDGSLTIPSCMETVRWTIFKNTIMISEAQLNKFRSLMSSSMDTVTGRNLSLVDNFRSLQMTNARVVYVNHAVTEAVSVGTATSASNALIIIISLVAALRSFIC